MVMASSLPQLFVFLVVVLLATCAVHALEPRTTDEDSGPDLSRMQLGSTDDVDPLRSYMLSRIVDDLQMVSSPQYQRQQRRNQEMVKRQIRFHQCYFNPVSCFRRRK